MFIRFFYFFFFVVVSKEMCCRLSNTARLIDVFWTRRHRQKHSIARINNVQTTFFFHYVGYVWLPCVVIPPSFCSHIYSSSGAVIYTLHACPAQRGSPGRTNPHRRVKCSPTVAVSLPLPSPTLSAFSRPTMLLPKCPRQFVLWPGCW